MGSSNSKQNGKAKDPKWQGIGSDPVPKSDDPQSRVDKSAPVKHHHNVVSIKKGKKKVLMKSNAANSVARKNKERGKTSTSVKHLDKYRGPNKKIRKSLIGNPSNFQPDKVRRQMAEVAAVLKFDETDFGASWQPPLPGTVPIAPGPQPVPDDAPRTLLNTRVMYHIPAPPPPSTPPHTKVRSPKSSLKKSSLSGRNRSSASRNRGPTTRKPLPALPPPIQETRMYEEKTEVEEEEMESGPASPTSAAPTWPSPKQRLSEDDGWIDVDEEEDMFDRQQDQDFGSNFSIPLQAVVSPSVPEPMPVSTPKESEPIVIPDRRSSMTLQLDVEVPQVTNVMVKQDMTPPQSHGVKQSISEEYGLITPPDSLRGNPLQHYGQAPMRQEYLPNHQRRTSVSPRPPYPEEPGYGSNGYAISPPRSVPVRDENAPHSRPRRHTGPTLVEQDPNQNYPKQRPASQQFMPPAGQFPTRQSPSWHSQSSERNWDERRTSDGVPQKSNSHDPRRSSVPQGFTHHQSRSEFNLQPSQKANPQDPRRSSKQQGFTHQQSQSELNLQMYHQYQHEFQQRQKPSRSSNTQRQQREYDENDPAMKPLVINF
ncbi:hypothetical protein BC936DRAFT_144336 [Jimgerdemannia flammicorona]|uniref:Uncharacterized protein n=1 Tax=Jimgerdemannia flammicorona TaxID=994334 RepID=A0A433DMM2_9FUNG|nr:hypothetical protein BC936DRAFT_144336 [Jimgerdemannia flammicorona]